MQEVILAQSVEVLCGSRVLPWETMANFARRKSEFLPERILVQDPAYHGRSSRTGTAHCFFLEEMRIKPASQSTEDCFALIWISGSKEFTNHRDRVFSLLGLLPKQLRDQIPVDYNADETASMVALGKMLVGFIPNLQTLSLKQPALDGKTLPSWCPDLHSPLISLNTLSHFDGLGAGIGIKNHSERPGPRIIPGSDNIGLFGFEVDHVRKVASVKLPPVFDTDTRKVREGFPAKLLHWEMSCRALLKLLRPRGLTADILEAYSRTLVANHFGFDDPVPLDHKMLDDFLTTMRMFTIAATQVKSQDYDPGNEKGDLARYVSALEAQYPRRFFTKAGGGIGIGVDGIKSGDKVCVFYTGRPLYVLRSDAQRGTYTYVGEAYVHGMMHLDHIPSDVRGKDCAFEIS